MAVKRKKEVPAETESPLFWPASIKGKTLLVLDETLLPDQKIYIKVRTVTQAVRVIRQMKTRAFGQLLVVLNAFLLELPRIKKFSARRQLSHLQKVAVALNQSRPTFPFAEVTGMCLAWAQKAAEAKQDVPTVLEKSINGYLAGIRARRLDRVARLAEVLADGDFVLTHCNVSGELAMAAALCQSQGKRVSFFATETRPYFQGAKLTTWELRAVGAEVTLVADNAIGALLSDGLVTKVVVGSDRNCANGDFANKIGTYQIAVLAKKFGVPLYVLTQPSTKIASGKDIPIEIRPEEELLKFNGRRIVPTGVKGFYPGFDVVPQELVTQSIAIDVGSTPSSSTPKDSPAVPRPNPVTSPSVPLAGESILSATDPAILLHGVLVDEFFTFLRQRNSTSPVVLTEGRPTLEAARRSSRLLLKNQLKPVLIADNMAGFLFARGLVKEVWLACRLEDSSGVLCEIGGLILAVLAQRHNVPVFCYQSQGRTAFLGKSEELINFQNTRIAARGIKAYVPLWEWVANSYVRKVY